MLKTATVEFALKCRVAFKHAPKTIAEAAQLNNFARTSTNATIYDAIENLHGSRTIGRHALLLDEAIDLHTAEVIAKYRGERFFGYAFASDESPPQGNRWAGLRFQITYAYHACQMWFEFFALQAKFKYKHMLLSCVFRNDT